MESKEFEKSPEFRRFKSAMQRLVRVSKSELDELVKSAKEESPRNGNPNAPGRKAKAKRRRKSKR